MVDPVPDTSLSDHNCFIWRSTFASRLEAFLCGMCCISFIKKNKTHHCETSMQGVFTFSKSLAATTGTFRRETHGLGRILCVNVCVGVVARSLARSLGRSLDRSAARSLSRSDARSLGRSVAGLLGRSLDRSVAPVYHCWQRAYSPRKADEQDAGNIAAKR